MGGVEWRDIPGFEGAYQVSNDGQVRSLDRDIAQGGYVRRWKGRILRPRMSSNRRECRACKYARLRENRKPRSAKAA